MSTVVRTPQDHIAAARRIAPLVDGDASAAIEQGRLTDAVVDAFHEQQLFRMMLPASLGGSDAPISAAFEVIEEITRADPSAGWTLMAGMSTLTIAGAYLGDEAVTELFADPRALTAGQLAPLGVAEGLGGSYRINGRFGFSSGSAHATHMFGGYREQRAGEQVKLPSGMPNIVGAVVPVDRVEFLGNWDVIGLISTRSEDYEVPEQEVPAGWTFPLFTASPLRGGPAVRVGVNALTCLAHSAWACGVGRRALDEIAAYAAQKRRPGRKTLIDDALFQYEYGKAEVELHNARAGALDALRAFESAAETGAVSQKHSATGRLVTTHACDVASRVTSTAYRFSGSLGLRSGSALHRVFRDIAAGEQHIFTDHNSVRDAATVYLGTAPASLFL